MFHVCTAAVRQSYADAVINVKTIPQSIAHRMDLLDGAWEDPLLQMLTDAMHTHANLITAGALNGDARAARNSREMAAFCLQYLTEDCMRTLPQVLGYPHVTIHLLDSDPEVARDTRDCCVTHLDLLLAAERSALQGDTVEALILDLIDWRLNRAVRVMLLLAKAESRLPAVGQQLLFISKAVHHSFF